MEMNDDHRYCRLGETMRRHIYDIPLQRTCETLVCLDQMPLAVIEHLLRREEAEIAAVCTNRGKIKLGIAAAMEAISSGAGRLDGHELVIRFSDKSIKAVCSDRQRMVLSAVARRNNRQQTS